MSQPEGDAVLSSAGEGLPHVLVGTFIVGDWEGGQGYSSPFTQEPHSQVNLVNHLWVWEKITVMEKISKLVNICSYYIVSRAKL